MTGAEIYGSGTVPVKGDTLRMLMVKEVISTNAGGGGGGAGQTVAYDGADATSSGVLPANVNADAIAYSRTGTGPTQGWNKNTQSWT